VSTYPTTSHFQRKNDSVYAENFRGVGKFRYNHVTSQFNFRGSAEGTTILGGPGGKPQENFAKLHLKIRIFVHSGSKF